MTHYLKVKANYFQIKLKKNIFLHQLYIKHNIKNKNINKTLKKEKRKKKIH